MRKQLLSKIYALVFLATTLLPLASWADPEPQPPPAVPEPSSWLLFGIGALGVGWAVHRRHRD